MWQLLELTPVYIFLSGRPFGGIGIIQEIIVFTHQKGHCVLIVMWPHILLH